MILPVTLTCAAIAALINAWLGWRVGQVRMSEKVLTGDGGNQTVICRMRAHANYTEYTPFVLVLIAAIELARGSTTALWAIGAVYMLARIAHAFGMDAAYPSKARMAGVIVTMLTLLILAGWAIWIMATGATPGAITDLPLNA